MSTNKAVTAEEWMDRLAIIEVKSCYAAGLDARDWDLWRNVFTDEAIFDLSSWNKVAPRMLDTDRVVRSQARVFAELITTQHFFTNHRITVDGDSARGVVHMRAEHWLQEEDGSTSRYTMFGYYDDKYVRTPDGWKMCEMQLNVTHTEGDWRVMSEATRRAQAKKKAQSSA
jgi:3-phenylpropionate/cinnamic acid dioxygenase small subunit